MDLVDNLQNFQSLFVGKFKTTDELLSFFNVVSKKLFNENVDQSNFRTVSLEAARILKLNDPRLMLPTNVVITLFGQQQIALTADQQQILSSQFTDESQTVTKLEHYSCQKCRQIMVQPIIVSPCGCLLCRCCFDRNQGLRKNISILETYSSKSDIKNSTTNSSIQKSDLKCPRCELLVEKLIIDEQIQTKIRLLQLCCPTKDCRFYGNFTQIQEHYLACKGSQQSQLKSLQQEFEMINQDLKNVNQQLQYFIRMRVINTDKSNGTSLYQQTDSFKIQTSQRLDQQVQVQPVQARFYVAPQFIDELFKKMESLKTKDLKTEHLESIRQQLIQSSEFQFRRLKCQIEAEQFVFIQQQQNYYESLLEQLDESIVVLLQQHMSSDSNEDVKLHCENLLLDMKISKIQTQIDLKRRHRHFPVSEKAQ